MKRPGRNWSESAWARMAVQDDAMRAVRVRFRPQDPIKASMMGAPEQARPYGLNQYIA